MALVFVGRSVAEVQFKTNGGGVFLDLVGGERSQGDRVTQHGDGLPAAHVDAQGKFDIAIGMSLDAAGRQAQPGMFAVIDVVLHVDVDAADLVGLVGGSGGNMQVAADL